MTFALTSQVVKDGNGNVIPGGVDMIDISGTGAGPWLPASVLFDPKSLQALTIKAANTPAVAADTAVVVTLSPNNVNPNGQAVAINSSPVVIASDQSVIPTSLGANTSGGASSFSAIMGAGTNATNVKSSPGQVYKIECFNIGGSAGYLKMYDSATAPTAGSGTPKRRVFVPPGAGVITTIDVGSVYAAGIGFTFTGGIADNDTTVVAGSTFIVNIDFK